MIQLAQPEGLAAEGGREAEDLTASHFPLAPGKPKQRSAEIKKQRGINNKEGEETGSEKGRGRGGVGPLLVFKKVIFHFRRNRFPLSGPLHIQNRVSLLVTDTGSVCLFFLSLSFPCQTCIFASEFWPKKKRQIHFHTQRNL